MRDPRHIGTQAAFPDQQAVVTAPTTLTPSPALAANFDAVDDNGTVIPPDTGGAVGPDHLVVAVNQEVAIQSRSGLASLVKSLDAFFGTAAGSAFDPHVLYDPFNARWILSAAADAQTAQSKIMVAVSATNDPSGVWDIFSVAADPSTGTSWADFPILGFNKNWIVVSVNMFPNTGSGFNGTKIYAFDKSALYSGSATTVSVFSTPASSNDFSIAPATTFDNSLASLYFLEDFDGATKNLRRFSISGPVGSEVMTRLSDVTLPLTAWSDAVNLVNFGFAPQLGSSDRIDNGDARFHNVVYRGGSLWASHTVFLPASAPTRSAAQWLQISASTGTVQQAGRMDDSTGAKFFAYPSLAVNKNNDMMMAYSRFSSTQYASANYTFRAAGDAANTLRSDTVYKAGLAPYFKTYGGPSNRWGDFSQSSVDPVNDTDMWTIQEYAGNSNLWGTWWGQLIVPVAGAPAVTLSTTSLTFKNQLINTTSSSQSVTLTNTGTSSLSIASIIAAGNFARTTTCGASLAPGSHCTISVTFHPTAIGTRTGTITITDNAADSPQHIALSGTGTQVNVSPASLAFSITLINTTSASKTVTITNHGSTVLSITGIAASGTFTMVSKTCGTTLAAAASCTVKVAFHPTAIGSAIGTLSVSDNGGGSPQTVNLSGTGTEVSLSPTSLSFTATVGTTSAAKTVILTNHGATALSITSIATTSTAFAIPSKTCGSTVSPGATCSINITFHPTAIGTKTGTLNVNDDGGGSPQHVKLTGTGQ